MNCWRTTWAAIISNVGTFLVSLVTGSILFPLASDPGKPLVTMVPVVYLFWMFVIGSVMTIIGKQLMGHHAADQKEVKKQLGLDEDGKPKP